MSGERDTIEQVFAAIEFALKQGHRLEDIAELMVGHDYGVVQSAVGTADGLAISYAQAHNLDVITSGHTGSKSNNELAQSNPLWLGVAAQCVAVGIVSADVGIAGAHFLSVTREDIKNAWLRLFKSGKEKAFEEIQRSREEDHNTRVARIVPLDNRKKRLVETIKAANDSYNALQKSVRGKSQPWVCITGLCYGTVKDRQILTREAQTAVQQIVHTGSMDLRIGMEGGVVYGGPQSKRFPVPAIITGL